MQITTLIGVGKLGHAILAYGGFAPQGFRIVEAFDNDPRVIGEEINGLRVRPVDDLDFALAARAVDIGIVATPAVAAQEVIDALVASGVKAILNYAPTAVEVPAYIQIKDVDRCWPCSR